MSATLEASEKKSSEGAITRFSLSQRAQHFLIMVASTVLVLTGLPQKYHDASAAQWVIVHLGGIDTTRLIHRFFGLVLLLTALYHIGYVVHHVFSRRIRFSMIFSGRAGVSMVPTMKDARDALTMLRYCLGLGDEPPKFDRFDYRQKFEYWAMAFALGVMIVTGLIMVYPIQTTYFLPGQFVAAAKELHTNEALLALLILVVWHSYSAHLMPSRFPFDSSIFTGKISREGMRLEHPLEYARLMGPGGGKGVPEPFP